MYMKSHSQNKRPHTLSQHFQRVMVVSVDINIKYLWNTANKRMSSCRTGIRKTWKHKEKQDAHYDMQLQLLKRTSLNSFSANTADTELKTFDLKSKPVCNFLKSFLHARGEINVELNPYSLQSQGIKQSVKQNRRWLIASLWFKATFSFFLYNSMCLLNYCNLSFINCSYWTSDNFFVVVAFWRI